MILEEYLKKHNFDKYFEKLNKKLKNKRIIIYGVGSLFQYVKQNYGFSGLNIVGISDSKYNLNDEGKEYLGYRIIPISKIEDYEFDVLIISIQEYLKVLNRFSNSLQNKKIIILPLVKKPLLTLLKKIWS